MSNKKTDNWNEVETIEKKILVVNNAIQNIQRAGTEIGYRNCLSGANIICTTLSYSQNLVRYIGNIDVCIVDEATQCHEASTLLPLQFGISALVLVGDTKQLGPTILSRKAQLLGLSQPLFKRIQDSFVGTVEKSPVLRLTKQYRMHPEICYWPSKFFYNGSLTTDETVNFDSFPLNPYTIIDLEFNQNNQTSKGAISNDG